MISKIASSCIVAVFFQLIEVNMSKHVLMYIDYGISTMKQQKIFLITLYSLSTIQIIPYTATGQNSGFSMDTIDKLAI